MLKRIGLVVMAVISMILLSSCNLKEKISESITENIIEKATDGEVDIDIDGDEISYSTEEGDFTVDDTGMTIEGDDGTVIASGGEYEWPLDQAAEYLPKLGKGTISYILNGPDTCMLMVDDLELDDYKDYKEEIVDAGYINDTLESSAEDLEIYSGTSSDGVVVTVSFSQSEAMLQVTADASGKQ